MAESLSRAIVCCPSTQNQDSEPRYYSVGGRSHLPSDMSEWQRHNQSDGKDMSGPRPLILFLAETNAC